MMISKLLTATAALFLAASSYAYAVDITSDPNATMNEQQKLGPNPHSYRLGNRVYTTRGAYAYYPRYHRHYWHHRYWR